VGGVWGDGGGGACFCGGVWLGVGSRGASGGARFGICERRFGDVGHGVQEGELVEKCD